MARRKVDVAARWVKSASPDDDYLPQEEPPAAASGLPKASTPAEAAWLAAFRRDEGLSIAESARPFGERPATKPVEADGRITTVIGRLELEEFKVAIEAKQIDSVGNLFAKRAPERERAVRTRRGKMSHLSVPVTLDEYYENEAKWQLQRVQRRGTNRVGGATGCGGGTRAVAHGTPIRT